MNQFDAFGDVVSHNEGIFDDGTQSIAGKQGGLHSYDNATTTPRQDGVAVGMQCRGCGRPLELLIEYPELVCIKYGVSPHIVLQMYPQLKDQVQAMTEWRYSSANQGWAPMQLCSHCRTLAPPIFSPEEAEGLLAKARRFGWISARGEKAVSECAYMAQQAAARASLGR